MEASSTNTDLQSQIQKLHFRIGQSEDTVKQQSSQIAQQQQRDENARQAERSAAPRDPTAAHRCTEEELTHLLSANTAQQQQLLSHLKRAETAEAQLKQAEEALAAIRARESSDKLLQAEADGWTEELKGMLQVRHITGSIRIVVNP